MRLSDRLSFLKGDLRLGLLSRRSQVRTIESYRSHRWAVRFTAAAAILLFLLISSVTGSPFTEVFTQAAVLVVAYIVVEALIVPPRWATTPTFNFYVSSMLGVSAAYLGYDFIVPSTEFYKAAASLIPVLFLAFVLEKRREYQATHIVGNRAIALFNIFFLLVAGKTCFDVLAFDDTRHGVTFLVVLPIVFTVVSMLMSLIAPEEQSVPSELGDEGYGELSGYL